MEMERESRWCYVVRRLCVGGLIDIRTLYLYMLEFRALVYAGAGVSKSGRGGNQNAYLWRSEGVRVWDMYFIMMRTGQRREKRTCKVVIAKATYQDSFAQERDNISEHRYIGFGNTEEGMCRKECTISGDVLTLKRRCSEDQFIPNSFRGMKEFQIIVG